MQKGVNLITPQHEYDIRLENHFNLNILKVNKHFERNEYNTLYM